jgi:hypothetical protein
MFTGFTLSKVRAKRFDSIGYGSLTARDSHEEYSPANDANEFVPAAARLRGFARLA